MSNHFDEAKTAAADLEFMSVEELLLLVGDEDRGCKSEALDSLLAKGLETNFPILEQAIRNNEHADLRNGAMEVVTRFGRQAVPKLLALLNDDNEEVRNFCTVMLGEIGSREAIGPLIASLRDTDANVQHGAAEALGKIGDRAALMPLLELLKEDFWQQYPAVTALAAMKDKRAVPHLVKLLDNDLLTGSVIDALGDIGDPRSLVPLGSILGKADTATDGRVVQAIVKIYRSIEDDCRYRNSMIICDHGALTDNIVGRTGIERIKALLGNGSNPRVVRDAITLLGWLNEKSVLSEMFSLLEDDTYLEAIENAILAMGKGTVPSLCSALRHPFDNVRILAVRSLRWLGEANDLEAVVELLSDRSEKVQAEVLESMRGSVIQGTIPKLVELMKSSNEEVSSRSAEVLGRYPYAQLQTILEEMISSPRAGMRRRAVTLLCNMRNVVPSDLFGFLVKDPDHSVKKEVVKSIGERKLVEALPALVEALNDDDAAVREGAVAALAEFGEKAPLQKILALLGRGGEALDYALLKAVGRIGSPSAGEALMEYLRTGMIGRCLVFEAIATLGKIGHSPAVPIISSVYLKHADSDIRRCAVQALGEIADPDSHQQIADACRDTHWSVRISALEAYARICGKKSLPVLMEALHDPDQMVRKNALKVLGGVREINAIARIAGLLTDPEIGKAAFETLLQYGRTSLPWLHRIMKGDYQLDVRERVIDLVGKIGDRKSVEALISLLDDSHSSIRLAAIDSLVFCFDSVPLKRLTHVIHSDDDGEVREKAALALKILTMEKFFP